MKTERYTVTAALPYTNGPIHIGHLAGVYVPADIYVRYLRSKGRDVVFVSGSDEHGIPITIKAREDGVTPQQIVDKYHALIKKSFSDFGISFDIYSRTSNKVHHDTASEFFTILNNKGVFEVKTKNQYYDEKAGQFLADRYIIGRCPNCGYNEAYGDQCESCGTSLSPSELINPRSALSGEKPLLKKTKHWYLPLNRYESWLKEWIIDGHKKDWKINVYGQCKSWIDQGLKPRAVTRDLDWGVPVPVDEGQGKVLYVWFDAPIGYISATKEWAAQTGNDWEKYWKNPGTKLVHFIGKDNIVFHCIIFPSMLKAHEEYILPANVPANEFLNLENKKISTSKNWAVWLHQYLEDFPGKQDVMRYVLCANAPETKDNDFTWKDFQAKNNNELVAILGNFINRAVVLVHKFFNGVIPERGELTEIDNKLIQRISEYPDMLSRNIENYKFRDALSTFMDISRLGNKYLADTEPWNLIKEDRERVGTILNLSLQVAANLAIMGEPFLPFTVEKINNILRLDKNQWNSAGSIDLIDTGHQINVPKLLFEKIENKAIEFQINKLNATITGTDLGNKDNNTIKAVKKAISYEDFSKLDMRIGTILEAEKIEKSNKLLKLKIDTGVDQRTVVSGIAKDYSPGEIVGMKVSILVNLAPKKIMGIESQGMILMGEGDDGKLAFLLPDKEIDNGSIIS
ncbi:MAG: methionine--tRNA ligase [Bacteroidetes bacterium]|nr:methionine--tRNA ligase [Bacteroidota bacterium]MCH8232862.1 methionine--tRNA ligase [Bacteroidota bacterium]